MKRSIDETADRFDEKSDEYDESRHEEAAATADRVVERVLQDVTGNETVVDVGTGTGILALDIAPQVETVYGLDISEGMLERGREKATRREISNVTFGKGRFRDPERTLSLPRGEVDLVVSNFAMHHLSDAEKGTALDELRSLLTDSGRFVLGDVIIFDEADVSTEYYSPEVDDPATIETLTDLFETRGFEVETERIGPMAGIVDGTLSGDSS